MSTNIFEELLHEGAVLTKPYHFYNTLKNTDERRIFMFCEWLTNIRHTVSELDTIQGNVYTTEILWM
jgi:hypothetical protein